MASGSYIYRCCNKEEQTEHHVICSLNKREIVANMELHTHTILYRASVQDGLLAGDIFCMMSLGLGNFFFM